MSTQSLPTSPRAHAARIYAAALEEDRQAAINACPEEWRDLALKHVAIAEQRAADLVRQREKLRPQSTPKPIAHATYQEPQQVRGSPAVAASHLASLRASIKPSREYRG